MKEITGYEVVEDRSPPHPENGYLTLHRLRVRTLYSDESRSDAYACEYITRGGVDAVCVAIYAGDGPDRRVLLRECARPPCWFRRNRELPLPALNKPYRTVTEVVAGVLEPGDEGLDGVRSRAAAEILEEAGFDVTPEQVELLGTAFFPTPGVYDEQVYIAAVRVDPTAQGKPTGDGSAMEEGAVLNWVPLEEAIERCRNGTIQDAKTEIALLRLRDA